MKDMKECFKPHVVIHSISGLGVGLILVGLIPSLATQALLLGFIVLVGSVVYEMTMMKKK